MSESGAGRGGQREHERYEVEIRVDWSTGRMFLADRAANISRGGLFIRSETPMSRDAEVEMVLWLPGRMPIRAVGRVVWSADPRRAAGHMVAGSGIQFSDIQPADRALLHDYLRELAAGARPAEGH